MNWDAMNSKWVFKIKYDVNEQFIYQFKARLIVREFTQQYEIDYDKTFTLTL